MAIVDGVTRLRASKVKLVDDSPMVAGATPEELWAAQARSRYVFECKLCGLRLELRDEKAFGITQKLLGAGMSRVRLTELARIV